MKCILGTKEEMTQVFDDAGTAHPATVLRVEPAVITLIRNKEHDGYEAIQIASGATKEHRLSKPVLGHLKGKGAFKNIKEFRVRAHKKETLEGLAEGATLDAGVFAPGDVVDVSATSKGKGFQGAVKRHGFGGQRRSHGNKHAEREVGSIGGGGRAGGRVIKGMRMAGRMGDKRVTVKNLVILQVHPESQTLVVSGAVPGRRGSLVEVRSH